ncbi:alpha/beta hydrolase family protein [Actomonas aquatica]|uniref:Alpha/beta fold hydrolase n=1 Tax=Actomonas aquatica TaxID=2866162 RepID=A0ABZ1CEJ5_9BACT|nr:alpha/beta fold hydrolase [Opitutus sp. WL0086]WRQ89913.1 alpha/beta fold hydrolase [Opitutus sp. WL0086]
MLPLSSLRPRALLLGALAAVTLPLSAAERPPVADFARTPIISQARLSPNGEALAFTRDYGGQQHLCVLDLTTDQITRFKIGSVPYNGTPMPKEVHRFQWVGDERLTITTTIWDRIFGSAAVDRDGKNWVGLTGYEFDPHGRHATLAIDVAHVFNDGTDRLLVLDHGRGYTPGNPHPDVLEIDTQSGLSKTIEENPGNVRAWMTDHEGIVRLGVVRDEDTQSVIYRDRADADWRTLPLPNRGHEKLRPYAFDPDNATFYVAGFNAEDRWCVLTYDLANGTVTEEPIVSDPTYDVVSNGSFNTYAGIDLTRPIFSARTQSLLGIAYTADFPRVKWLDPEFATIQAAVDRARAGRVNVLVNQSRDDQRLLFFSYSDRDPGSYFLLDRTARSFKPLGARMDWIDPAAMSPSMGISYEARDGTTIHGYLTLPAGHKPKNLPLVVLPHGGPWVRDNWGFDPIVQLIASRGYAVLQMNYRGSKGYGSAFEWLGKQNIGRGIQDDIEDATRWAIRAKVADPKRIAIAGGSYGGYSALFALGKSPDLYACGISLNGVTDWEAIFDRADKDRDRAAARKTWVERIGDPDEDPDFFRSISPVNFGSAIKAPVLIIQGRQDKTVPLRQARRMYDALGKSKGDSELLWLRKSGHSLSNESERTEAFAAIVAFLEKHLGPGVPYQPTNTP